MSIAGCSPESFGVTLPGVLTRVMQEPHLLKASANCRRLRANLVHLLSPTSLAAIDAELDSNVKQLLALAESHFRFALTTPTVHWRQRVSRFYYASYALSRAVRLHIDGVYTTDVKDHEKVGDLPADFPRRERYKNDLRALREDRNLSDYDHTASESELAFTQSQTEHLVQELTADAENYLKARGLAL